MKREKIERVTREPLRKRGVPKGKPSQSEELLCTAQKPLDWPISGGYIRVVLHCSNTVR
jgi:hypothetical protein